MCPIKEGDMADIPFSDIVGFEISALQFCIDCWINNLKIDKEPFQYITIKDIVTCSMIKIDSDFYKCSECGKFFYRESSRAESLGDP